MIPKRIFFFIIGRWCISATLVSPNISLTGKAETEIGGKSTDSATFPLNASDGSPVLDSFSRSAPARKTQDTENKLIAAVVDSHGESSILAEQQPVGRRVEAASESVATARADVSRNRSETASSASKISAVVDDEGSVNFDAVRDEVSAEGEYPLLQSSAIEHTTLGVEQSSEPATIAAEGPPVRHVSAEMGERQGVATANNALEVHGKSVVREQVTSLLEERTLEEQREGIQQGSRMQFVFGASWRTILGMFIVISAVTSVAVRWCCERAEPLVNYVSTFVAKEDEFNPFCALVVVHKVDLAQPETQITISALARKKSSSKGFGAPGSAEMDFASKVAAANGGVSTSGKVSPANASAKLVVAVKPATPRIQVCIYGGWLQSFLGGINLDTMEDLHGGENLDKVRFDVINSKGRKVGVALISLFIPNIDQLRSAGFPKNELQGAGSNRVFVWHLERGYTRLRTFNEMQPKSSKRKPLDPLHVLAMVLTRNLMVYDIAGVRNVEGRVKFFEVVEKSSTPEQSNPSRGSSSRMSLSSQKVHFKWVIYEDKSLTEEPGSILKDNMESFVPFRAIIGTQFIGVAPDKKLVLTYKTREGGRDQLVVAPRPDDMLDIDYLSDTVKEFMRQYGASDKRARSTGGSSTPAGTLGGASMTEAQSALLAERASSRGSDSDEEEE